MERQRFRGSEAEGKNAFSERVDRVGVHRPLSVLTSFASYVDGFLKTENPSQEESAASVSQAVALAGELLISLARYPQEEGLALIRLKTIREANPFLASELGRVYGKVCEAYENGSNETSKLPARVKDFFVQ